MSTVTTTTMRAQMHRVTRIFRRGQIAVAALRDITMEVHPGELVALRGRSGAGKTTLLNILVGLDDPTEGEVMLLGQPLAGMNEAARAQMRRERVGLLFQNAHLFPALTAQENVEVALRLLSLPAAERQTRAQGAIERVGLAARAHHRGLELSGGEQHCIALARALAHQPQLVIADEPTGNLDSRTGRDIAALLRATAHEQGIGVLVATHDPKVVAVADRVLTVQDGVLQAQ